MRPDTRAMLSKTLGYSCCFIKLSLPNNLIAKSNFLFTAKKLESSNIIIPSFRKLQKLLKSTTILNTVHTVLHIKYMLYKNN